MATAEDKESDKYTKFRSDNLSKEDVEIWYAILVGAALVDPTVRPKLLAGLRVDHMPMRFRLLFGTILSEQKERTQRVLEKDFYVQRRGEPIDAILDEISHKEDYNEMIDARAEIAKVACFCSPTALVREFEKQAEKLKSKIRNFENGDSPEEAEAV